MASDVKPVATNFISTAVARSPQYVWTWILSSGESHNIFVLLFIFLDVRFSCLNVDRSHKFLSFLTHSFSSEALSTAQKFTWQDVIWIVCPNWYAKCAVPASQVIGTGSFPGLARVAFWKAFKSIKDGGTYRPWEYNSARVTLKCNSRWCDEHRPRRVLCQCEKKQLINHWVLLISPPWHCFWLIYSKH